MFTQTNVSTARPHSARLPYACSCVATWGQYRLAQVSLRDFAHHSVTVEDAPDTWRLGQEVGLHLPLPGCNEQMTVRAQVSSLSGGQATLQFLCSEVEETQLKEAFLHLHRKATAHRPATSNRSAAANRPATAHRPVAPRVAPIRLQQSVRDVRGDGSLLVYLPSTSFFGFNLQRRTLDASPTDERVSESAA